MPSLAVIIPTRNRRALLAKTLESLWGQELPWGAHVEVIIADDGSTDDTRYYVQNIKPVLPWQIRLVAGPPHGAAAARNRAVQACTADIVLFSGDDILLRPQTVAAHLDWHLRHPEKMSGALGFVVWDPRCRPTRLMMWMTHGGPQNGYDQLLGLRSADPRHFFCAANISVKRAAVVDEPFATVFQGYGWEDIELGRRLAEQGFTLAVLPHALALHHHIYSVAGVAARQGWVGRNVPLYQRLHPDAALLKPAVWLTRLKRVVSRYLHFPLGLKLLTQSVVSHYTTPRLYQRFTAAYFWRGVDITGQKK